jgi:Uma2 family endonuclease
MATEAKQKDRGGSPYRLTVRQFLDMIELGVFPHDARIELLRGILVEHPKKSTRHDFAVCELSDQLRKMLPTPWFVREEKSIELGRTSRVSPDIALIRGPRDPHQAQAPRAESVGFLIEVSDSTYLYDRGVKWRAYASAMIPAYWIVNMTKREIEVYRDPQGRGKTASFGETTVFGPESEIPVFLEGREIGRISVKDVIP